MRATFLVIMLGLVAIGVVSSCQAEDEISSYDSPYQVALPWDASELIPDMKGERGDPKLEGQIPFSKWYNHEDPWVGPWGPLPRAYLPPSLIEDKTDDWKRARLIAAALRYKGYHYRHHYIPDWNPPLGWYTPKESSERHDGKGVDCSNFTSFVINQALGLGISSDIHIQAEADRVTVHGSGEERRISVISAPDAVEKWSEVLKPGDLLFIRSSNNLEISHVVFWIGPWSLSPDAEPLVLDSHGEDVRDSNGAMIPAGIQLRPFRMNSWYALHASHAIRIIGQ